MERVENSAGRSIPDVYFQTNTGLMGWIELKWTNNVGNKITFQDGQERWLEQHCRWGGFALVVVGHQKSKKFSVYWGADFWDPGLEENITPDNPLLIADMNAKGFQELLCFIKQGFNEHVFFRLSASD